MKTKVTLKHFLKSSFYVLTLFLIACGSDDRIDVNEEFIIDQNAGLVSHPNLDDSMSGLYLPTNLTTCFGNNPELLKLVVKNSTITELNLSNEFDAIPQSYDNSTLDFRFEGLNNAPCEISFSDDEANGRCQIPTEDNNTEVCILDYEKCSDDAEDSSSCFNF